jgi:hypothetical protein
VPVGASSISAEVIVAAAMSIIKHSLEWNFMRNTRCALLRPVLCAVKDSKYFDHVVLDEGPADAHYRA